MLKYYKVVYYDGSKQNQSLDARESEKDKQEKEMLERESSAPKTTPIDRRKR
jgi:hypothetical protein